MNFFLFEKYNISKDETDSSVIKSTLNTYKANADWNSKLKSKNDKIKSKALKEKSQFEKNCEILLDSVKRNEYLKEYAKSVSEIVEYINDNDKQENSFEEIANIQGISVEDIKQIWASNKQTAEFSNEDLNETQQLAFQINKVQNSFNALVQRLERNTITKFSTEGIDLHSFSDALKIEASTTSKMIEDRARYISETSYNLYNNKIISSDIKNALMDIFDPVSKSDDSIFSFTKNKNLDKCFKQNDWVLFRYIRITCLLMKKSEPVGSQKITNIPSKYKSKFIESMKCIFGVQINATQESSDQQNSVTNPKEPPYEVELGENELSLGHFEEANALFQQASKSDPYCWQAYWGMFKSSIKAKSDSEIFFPGFLESLHKSERSNNCPDYVNYYKFAKETAIEQKTDRINFNAIEMEYKKADKTNEDVKERIYDIKRNYERVDIKRIPTAEGKESALKFLKTVERKKELEDIKASSYLTKIFMILMGISLLCLTTFTIDVEYFDRLDNYAVIVFFILALSPPIYVAIWVHYDTDSGWLTAISFILSVVLEFCIIGFSEILIVKIISVCVLGIVGLIFFIKGIREFAAKTLSGKRFNDSIDQLKDYITDLTNYCINDQLKIINERTAILYHIEMPENTVPDFSKYLTDNSSIKHILFN